MAPEIGGTAAALRRLRLYWTLLVILVFFWLPLEDTQLRWVLIISSALSSLFAIRSLVALPVPRRTAVRLAVTGLAAGLLAAPIALALMVLKTGLHGHGRPDFTASQIGQVLQTAPFLALGGLLVGLGAHFWLLAGQETK